MGEEFEKAQNKTIEVEKTEDNNVFASHPAYPAGAYPYPYPPQAPYGAYPYPYPPQAPQPAPQFYNAQTGEPYQMPPIVQPVAFVPYVTQEQPLMQYTPADVNPTVKPQK